MLVEFVDWDSGAGMAVKIYNPTANAISLSTYNLNIYSNGSTLASSVSPLIGTLAPGAAIIVGNDSYNGTNCPGSSNTASYTPFTIGVNGDETVALVTASGTVIDAIGRIGFSAGNMNSQKIGTTNDALFQHKIVRKANNLSRYTLTSGTYNPTILNAANIWPNNTTTSVQGWDVFPVTCLTAGTVMSSGNEKLDIKQPEFYPNPATRKVTVQHTFDENRTVSISLFNNLGKKVCDKVFADKIDAPLEIDLSGIAGGVYSLQVSDGEAIYIKKLLIE